MVHLPNFKCNNSKELRKSISYFACKTIASRFYDDKLVPDSMTLLVYMYFTALRILTVHHNSNNLGHILDIKKNEAKNGPILQKTKKRAMYRYAYPVSL